MFALVFERPAACAATAEFGRRSVDDLTVMPRSLTGCKSKSGASMKRPSTTVQRQAAASRPACEGELVLDQAQRCDRRALLRPSAVRPTAYALGHMAPIQQRMRANAVRTCETRNEWYRGRGWHMEVPAPLPGRKVAIVRFDSHLAASSRSTGSRGNTRRSATHPMVLGPAV